MSSGILVNVLFLVILAALARGHRNGGNPRESFIRRLKPYADEIDKEYNISPVISIGHAIFESNWGDSRLTQEANNLFGVKATMQWKLLNNPVWTGQASEFQRYLLFWSNEINVTAEFKKYKNYSASFRDYAKLMSAAYPESYKAAQKGDISGFAKNIAREGWATDPEYAEKIYKRINEVLKLM